jgi:hypothetical protein
VCRVPVAVAVADLVELGLPRGLGFTRLWVGGVGVPRASGCGCGRSCGARPAARPRFHKVVGGASGRVPSARGCCDLVELACRAIWVSRGCGWGVCRVPVVAAIVWSFARRIAPAHQDCPEDARRRPGCRHLVKLSPPCGPGSSRFRGRGVQRCRAARVSVSAAAVEPRGSVELVVPRSCDAEPVARGRGSSRMPGMLCGAASVDEIL